MNNRERNWYEGKYGRHPPACLCPDCERRRQTGSGSHIWRAMRGILGGKKGQGGIAMSFRRPHNVTRKILIAVAIIFAVLAGLSAMAWLLPNAFAGLGDALVRLTGNPDVALNFIRMGRDPVLYTVAFALFAVGIRWLANKF